MNAADAQLRKSIRLYGVLLGRPFWLGPDLADEQLDIWRDSVERYPAKGELLASDVADAIHGLLTEGDRMDPRQVMPPHIIQAAVSHAADRRRRADELVGFEDSMLMYAERVTWNHARRHADPDADEVMHTQLQRAIADVRTSGLPVPVVADMVRRLTMMTANLGLGDRPPMPSLED